LAGDLGRAGDPGRLAPPGSPRLAARTRRIRAASSACAPAARPSRLGEVVNMLFVLYDLCRWKAAVDDEEVAPRDLAVGDALLAAFWSVGFEVGEVPIMQSATRSDPSEQFVVCIDSEE
jgi:hypothetical protein